MRGNRTRHSKKMNYFAAQQRPRQPSRELWSENCPLVGIRPWYPYLTQLVTRKGITLGEGGLQLR